MRTENKKSLVEKIAGVACIAFGLTILGSMIFSFAFLLVTEIGRFWIAIFVGFAGMGLVAFLIWGWIFESVELIRSKKDD